MLRELHLRNIGVIAEAAVEFDDGLNVVTGETGVGKTMLVTSLALVTGARAPGRLVGAEGDEASVEAVFDLSSAAKERLSELGIDSSEELIVTRRIGADGRTKAWADGRLVPAAVLAEIGDALVELHGQGAGFALARTSTQLQALDALAGNGDVLASYLECLRGLRALHEERVRLQQDASARDREMELLTFQADEIERAKLEPREDESVAEQLVRLEHAEKLAEVAARVISLVDSEAAAGELAEAHRALEDVTEFDASIGPLVERLGEVAALAAEAASDIRAWAESIDGDPVRVEALRDRRALIGSLKRKYGPTLDEVLAAGRSARERLSQLDGVTGRLESLEAEADAARTAAENVAGELSKRRRRAAKKLTEMVSAELPALALPNAVFDASCEPVDEWTEHGRDRVAFRFSESHTRPADLIGKIASGGELSRAMIAVTLALAQAHSVPVLVFDEADQGVGGEAALEVARRLQRLGRTHQVLVVSHLPQIAAFADRHIAIRRSANGVVVETVTSGERVAEISRMLAGLESSKLARAHAGELLDLAGRERKDVSPGELPNDRLERASPG